MDKNKRAEQNRSYRAQHKDAIAMQRHSYYLKHRDEFKARQRRWNIENGTYASEYARQYRKRNSEEIKARKRKPLELLAGRPKPEICDIRKEPHWKITFDHCHRTGKFRDWICSNCNLILGLSKDNADKLQALSDYLRLHT